MLRLTSIQVALTAILWHTTYIRRPIDLLSMSQSLLHAQYVLRQTFQGFYEELPPLHDPVDESSVLIERKS